MLNMKSNAEKNKSGIDNWREKSKPGEEYLEYMVKYEKNMMKTSMITSV